METLFTWLHLSDLQVRAAGSADRALTTLRRDLLERADERIDVVLVTGDVSWSGQKDELAAADRILVDLARAAGVGPDRVYVVAGNHDVDRGADPASLAGKLVAELKQGRRRFDAALEHARAREVLTGRLRAFAHFAAAFGPPPADDDAAPEDLLWWSRRVEGRAGLPVRIVGLCTAFLADGDADRGSLRVGETQLHGAAGGPGQGELTVVLGHHPARGGWLADERDLDAWLRDHAHVHLTGHVHDPAAEEARAGVAGPYVWVTAGAAPARRKPGPGGARRFGYAIGAVVRAPDGALRLQVTPRRLDASGTGFEPDDRHLAAGQTSAARPLRMAFPVRMPEPSIPPPERRAVSGTAGPRFPPPTPPPPPAWPAAAPTPPPPPVQARLATPPPPLVETRIPPTPPPPPPLAVRLAAARDMSPRAPPAAEPPLAGIAVGPELRSSPGAFARNGAPEARRGGRGNADLVTPPRAFTPEPPPVREEPTPGPRRLPSFFEGPGTLPAQPVTHFHGRDTELAALGAALDEPGVTSVVVVGPGGAGKTAMVQQYVAAMAPSSFEACAWIDARELPTELARVAKRLGWRAADRSPWVDEAVRYLRGALESRRVLLVVDHVAPGMADVRFLPIPGGSSRTIITSRILTLHEDLGQKARRVRVGAWDDETARGYLRAVVPGLAAEPDGALDELVRRVSGLPLALRLVARLLLRSGVTPAALAARLDREPLAALEAGARGTEAGVVATFLGSIERLGERERGVLVALAASASPTRARVVAEVAGVREDEAALGLEGLAEQSLVEWRPDDERPFRLNALVRFLLQAQRGADAADAAHTVLVRSLLVGQGTAEGKKTLEHDLGEVLTCVDRLAALGEAPTAWALLKEVRSLLDRRGRYAELASAAKRILDALPQDSEEAAEALADLGIALSSLGDAPRARDALELSLALAEERGFSEAEALALGGLGRCYALLGDVDRAIAHHRRAASLHERSGARRLYANDLGNMGLLYRRKGDVGGAIEHLERALAIHEELDAPEGRAEVLGGLGLCFRDIGEHAAALDHFERALALHAELGARTGQATMLGNLGNTYRTMGDVGRAVDHLERALAIYEELGLSEGQGAALGNLGACYRALGDAARARDHYERALAAFRRVGLPDAHPHVRAILGALGQGGGRART